jgi:pimeloyl-ACP methyl ester carboxylesterase
MDESGLVFNNLAAFVFGWVRLGCGLGAILGGGINVPTLVLAGWFDRIGIPRCSVQFKTFTPQAQFVMFEKSGHLSFLEEPE